MTTSEIEEMLEKCYEVGCCGNILHENSPIRVSNFILTDTPCDRCPVLTDIRLYVEELNKGEK